MTKNSAKAIKDVDKLRVTITSEILNLIDETKKEVYNIQRIIDSKLVKLEVSVEQEIREIEDGNQFRSRSINYDLSKFDCDFRIKTNFDVIQKIIELSSNSEEVETIDTKTELEKILHDDSFQSTASDESDTYKIRENRHKITQSNSLTTLRTSSQPEFQNFLPYMIPKPKFNINEIVKVKVLIFDHPKVLVEQIYPDEDRKFLEFQSKLQTFYSDIKNLKVVKRIVKNFIAVVNHQNLWKRCLIMENQENDENAKVSLIDYGIEENYPSSSIYCLAREFNSFPQKSFYCCFADIILLPNDDQQVVKVESLIKSCLQWNYHVEIKITNSRIGNPVHFYFDDQKNQINFNLMLVHLGLAEHGCEKPRQDLSKPLNIAPKADKNFNHVKLRLLHVEGVSEFYAVRQDQYEDFQLFCSTVKFSAIEDNNNIKEWKIGEKCVVKHARVGEEISYLRGKIIKILDDSSEKCWYEVHAIDYGYKVRTNEDNIIDIEECTKSMDSKCLKLQLMEIVGSKKIDEKFRSIIEQVRDKNFEITAQFGELNSTKNYEFLPITNIFCRTPDNKVLDVKSILVKDEIDENLKISMKLKPNLENRSYNNRLIFIKNRIIDVIPTKISSWLPHQFPSSSFKGTIKCVKENGNFFIQSETDEKFASLLREELTMIYTNYKQSSFNYARDLPVIFQHDDGCKYFLQQNFCYTF